MAKDFDLFTFGETLALFMTTDTDSVITARNYSMDAAGTEANVAVAAHNLGLNVYFQTKLGPDELGIAVSNKFADVDSQPNTSLLARTTPVRLLEIMAAPSHLLIHISADLAQVQLSHLRILTKQHLLIQSGFM